MTLSDQTTYLLKNFFKHYVHISELETCAEQSLQLLDALEAIKNKLRIADEKNKFFEQRIRFLENQLSETANESDGDSFVAPAVLEKLSTVPEKDEQVVIDSFAAAPLNYSDSAIMDGNNSIQSFIEEKKLQFASSLNEDTHSPDRQEGIAEIFNQKKAEAGTFLFGNIATPAPTPSKKQSKTSSSSESSTDSKKHRVKHHDVGDDCQVCKDKLSLSESFICVDCSVVFHRKCYTGIPACYSIIVTKDTCCATPQMPHTTPTSTLRNPIRRLVPESVEPRRISPIFNPLDMEVVRPVCEFPDLINSVDAVVPRTPAASLDLRSRRFSQSELIESQMTLKPRPSPILKPMAVTQPVCAYPDPLD